jgi:hypothetical protein
VIDRLSSGQPKLDSVLNGGLLLNATNLVIGVPGSGKTILSQQYVFHNASIERPALVLSTVTEPLDKILRYGEALSFFDSTAVRDRRVIYEDLGYVLSKDGLSEVLTVMDGFLKEVRPGIVVIDSFKAFHAFAKEESDFRLFLYGLSRPTRESRPKMRLSSQSQTASLRSTPRKLASARYACSRCSNYAVAAFALASILTGSRPMGSTCFRASRTRRTGRSMSSATNAFPQASTPLTRCWAKGIGPGRPRW